MQDYEMYDGDIRQGIINVYWDNITNKYNKSIINSYKGNKYKLISVDDNSQKYELYFNIDNIDDLYDIVSKYISEDNNRFKEIDKIKKYNGIKNIKKNTTIKLLLPIIYLKYFNKTLKDVDKNSIINSKIYFIKKVVDTNNLDNERKELDSIIKHFNNIISSNEYSFYEDSEKEKIMKDAINKLNKIIDKIELDTSYKYGKHFMIDLKIK